MTDHAQPKRRPGRPPLPEGERKSGINVTFRARAGLRERLVEEAARLDRSLGELIEYRLEKSLEWERMFGGEKLELFKLIDGIVDYVMAHNKRSWRDDKNTREDILHNLKSLFDAMEDKEGFAASRPAYETRATFERSALGIQSGVPVPTEPSRLPEAEASSDLQEFRKELAEILGRVVSQVGRLEQRDFAVQQVLTGMIKIMGESEQTDLPAFQAMMEIQIRTAQQMNAPANLIQYLKELRNKVASTEEATPTPEEEAAYQDFLESWRAHLKEQGMEGNPLLTGKEPSFAAWKVQRALTKFETEYYEPPEKPKARSGEPRGKASKGTKFEAQ
jgi:hypothetical protein